MATCHSSFATWHDIHHGTGQNSFQILLDTRCLASTWMAVVVEACREFSLQRARTFSTFSSLEIRTRNLRPPQALPSCGSREFEAKEGCRTTVAQEVTLGEGLGDLARSASRAARTRRAQRAPEENFEPTRPLHAISFAESEATSTHRASHKRALSKARCAGALRARRCAPASGTAYR